MRVEFKNLWAKPNDSLIQRYQCVFVLSILGFLIFCIEYYPTNWFALGFLNFGLCIYFEED
jgi:hypothetical protein